MVGDLRGRILTIGCHSERSEESVIDSSVAPLLRMTEGGEFRMARE